MYIHSPFLVLSTRNALQVGIEPANLSPLKIGDAERLEDYVIAYLSKSSHRIYRSLTYLFASLMSHEAIPVIIQLTKSLCLFQVSRDTCFGQ